MSGRKTVLALLLLLAAGLPLASVGCGKARQKQVGLLKEWIVGDWARDDDPAFWNFNASGELMTTGRLPIGGSYVVEEPNKIKVTISGAGALTASMMLKVPLHENRNLYLDFIVQDDEMRPSGIESKVVFRKQKP